MKNQNILSAYCFLAALTENNNDLYNHVYVPICKRALSEYSKKGNEYGTHIDIKELILDIYGIDVPESVVCKLIRGVEASLSRRKKEEIKFKVINVGREFQLEKWAFTELDEKYAKSERDANAIQNAFEEFLRIKNTFNEEVPNFSEFLNRYKLRLSSFFTGEIKSVERNNEESFFYHVEFLEYIQRLNHSFYKIAEELYLGAIVAGFLESGFEIEHPSHPGEIYYLDTPVVLRALDLQKPEDTRPIMELIKLIRQTGCIPKVLSITVEEIQRVISNAVETYNNSRPVTTINEACKRKGKDKVWLLTFSLNLAKNIQDELKIDLEPVSSEFIKLNAENPDIPALKELRFCKNNASHDVFSYLYVRAQRGTAISVHQNAKIWFITSNPSLLNFNIEKKLQGSVPEIVLPDMLTSLLWLKNPLQLVNNVKSIGLKELMASTLLEEIASRELIIEYSNQLKKIDDLDEESFTILLEAVAHYSANSIEKFIDSIDEDPINAKAEALRIVDEEKKRRIEILQKITNAEDEKDFEKMLNQELEEKISKIEKFHKEQSEKANQKIEELEQKVQEQHKSIERQENVLKEHEEKIKDQNSQIQLIKNQIKKDSIRLIIGFLGVVVFILTFVFKDYLGDWKWIAGVLSGSGWIWGFGSFSIHIYRLINNK